MQKNHNARCRTVRDGIQVKAPHRLLGASSEETHSHVRQEARLKTTLSCYAFIDHSLPVQACRPDKAMGLEEQGNTLWTLISGWGVCDAILCDNRGDSNEQIRSRVTWLSLVSARKSSCNGLGFCS